MKGSSSPQQPADLVIAGGTILTVDLQNTVVPDGAIAIRDGAIAAVGTRKQIEMRRRWQ